MIIARKFGFMSFLVNGIARVKVATPKKVFRVVDWVYLMVFVKFS